MSMGFAKSKFDPNLSHKVVEVVPVILFLYVDDLFLTGNEKQIMESKKKLAEKFEMKDLGLMHYFLGLEVWKISEGIFLNQGKYAVEILKRFNMLECKAMATPMDSNLKLLADDSSELVDMTHYRQIIGSLMYLKNTRPDICFDCEHLKSISCSTKTGSPSNCKACDEISERDYILWFIL